MDISPFYIHLTKNPAWAGFLLNDYLFAGTGVAADIALPCAIQNEVDENDLKEMVNNKVRYIAEGANQPLTIGAADKVQETSILYAPGKASNAGGVACSCFDLRL